MTMPLTSYEIRWFFTADSREDTAVRRWFEAAQPVPRDAGMAPPLWQGRLDGEPDIYLVLPGHADMGIKWREGLLQIKGRVADLGVQLYCGRHRGRAGRWIKWSYAGLPGTCKEMFTGDRYAELARISVRKRRAMRKLRLNTFTGEASEVAAATILERGIGIELTEIEIDGIAAVSLGFEAFPDDSGMLAAFASTVQTFLGSLTAIDLDAAQSLSYPEWLRSL